MEPEDTLQDLVRRFARAEKRQPPSAPIRELPPPYTEVRSGFPGWHICATDDCGRPRNEPF